MSIKKENESSIIEEILKSKREEYELYVENENRKNNIKRSIDHILEDLEICYLQDIPEKSRKAIRECHDRLDYAWNENLDFIKQEFYKLGFKDGMRMSEEIKEDIIKK